MRNIADSEFSLIVLAVGVWGIWQTAVAGMNLPKISGSKDWGAYEITGLKVKELRIDPENVQVNELQTIARTCII